MEERYRRYLQTMGIQVWTPRRPAQGGGGTTPGAPDMGEAPANGTGAAEIPADDAERAVTGEDRNLDTEGPADARGGDGDRAARIARMDWSELEAAVGACTACALHATRTRAVFGVGDRHAHWMVIGEAPGADEDRLGEPFVGRAGKLLDAMLLALGLTREQVFIANILKSRPPNNRDPAPEEVAACWPFLARQIALVSPRIILAVGRIAAQNLLQAELPLAKLRGRVHRFGAGAIPVVVTYHPAYLLRSPREKRKAWEDLQLAQRTLAAGPGPESGGLPP